MADAIETPETPNAQVDEGADRAAEGAGRDGVSGEKPVAPAEERKFRLKFGKDEREVTEREAIALAQKGWAADEKFQSAAKKEKAIRDAIKNGDLDYLIRQKYGKDPDDWAKERLQAKLRMLTMTPEERELHERRQEIERLRSEGERMRKEQEGAKRAQLQQHYEQQYDKELSEAIQKEGLPKNRVAVKRAVDIASKLVDMGLEPDWGLVVKEAKRQIVDEMKELFGGYKDEDLLDLLGEDLPKRLGKAMATRASVVGRAKAPRVEGAIKERQPEEKPKAMDMNDWIKNQRKKFEEG